MSWEDVLKLHCGTEKTDEEKILVGNQFHQMQLLMVYSLEMRVSILVLDRSQQ